MTSGGEARYPMGCDAPAPMAAWRSESEDSHLDHVALRGRAERHRRGIGPAQDCFLVARSGKTSIWQTEKTGMCDCPISLPPMKLWRVLYRGFEESKLSSVLRSGLDVPPQSAFCATEYADKAWEYPPNRAIATMLVLDPGVTQRSFVTRPAGADGAWIPDRALYPNEYVDDGVVIHTRFTTGHFPACFEDEHMYGHWVPGDARSALLAVVIGGSRPDVLQRLRQVNLDDPYTIEFVGSSARA